jgi:hypothetical protein
MPERTIMVAELPGMAPGRPPPTPRLMACICSVCSCMRMMWSGTAPAAPGCSSGACNATAGLCPICLGTGSQAVITKLPIRGPILSH